MRTPRSEPSPSPAPHVIPYQGSKRLLAPRILSLVAGRRFEALWEPFAASAAITLAAARLGLAERFEVSDTLEPLTRIWQAVLDEPEALADGYERLWREQLGDEAHYTRVRAAFNAGGGAGELLYLMARCVKNAPRFNAAGEFNQSHDKRRRGMNPDRMRAQVAGAAQLLAGRTRVRCLDAAAALDAATSRDLVYLDPPWEGTTVGADKRYHQGLAKDELVELLEGLNRSDVPFLLSYDGRCGDRTYGEYLPEHLEAVRLELPAGRSSQATLVGRSEQTVESLYVSRSLHDPALAAAFAPDASVRAPASAAQLALR